VKDDRIVIKTKYMKSEEIYHCVFQNKVYLFFRDEHEILNCYEVEDREAADAIRANPDTDSIKAILQKYAKKHQMD
ncbi:MAG: hypothetical protein QXP61_05860, partial [Nitrososphaerales archaeon]